MCWEHEKDCLVKNILTHWESSIGWHPCFDSRASIVLPEVRKTKPLKDLEKCLGRDHPTTIAYRSLLGAILQDQGEHEMAEKVSREVLKDMEDIFGKKQLSTLRYTTNLVAILLNRRRYLEAEKRNRLTLDRFKKVLGEKHPNTLVSINHLAIVLQEQCKYKAAALANLIC
jgi:hypothetical protein